MKNTAKITKNNKNEKNKERAKEKIKGKSTRKIIAEKKDLKR